MMTNENIQILNALKEGLTPAEVAQSLGHDIEVIEYVVKTNGEMGVELAKDKLNKAQRVEDKLGALEDLAIGTIKQILQCGDKDSTRLAASIEVLDTIRGLKQPKNPVTVNYNFDINARLNEVEARRMQMLNGANVNVVRKPVAVVDVEAAVVA